MKLLADLYLPPRLFWWLSGAIASIVLGFGLPVLAFVGKIVFLATLAVFLFDIYQLFGRKGRVVAERICPNRLSNGDPNPIHLHFTNAFPFSIVVTVIDELPAQLQHREKTGMLKLGVGELKSITYSVTPVARGEYHFGHLNIFVKSPLGLAERRIKPVQPTMLPVYPSFIQMHKYELMAISNRLQERGVKKIRKLGHNMEFEQIKEYVAGDDFRTMNWLATARKGQLMVNQYQDEKSQSVYAIIDKGRPMKTPFAGMTLLDYAINASLAICNIAIRKQDKAGLVTFNTQVDTQLAASARSGQMRHIIEALYNEEASYQETDYEQLYMFVKRQVKQRSLLLLFTNFDAPSSMERQLPYLKNLAKSHVVVVIFFEDTELAETLGMLPTNTEQIYFKTIASKFAYDKRLIVKELQQNGIQAILTPPEQLTVQTINKYLELKARNTI